MNLDQGIVTPAEYKKNALSTLLRKRFLCIACACLGREKNTGERHHNWWMCWHSRPGLQGRHSIVVLPEGACGACHTDGFATICGSGEHWQAHRVTIQALHTQRRTRAHVSARSTQARRCGHANLAPEPGPAAPSMELG